jgi:hypothetical protein
MLKRREAKKESKEEGINKKELLEDLIRLSFALGKKDIGKQTTCFIFMNDYIHVYNDEIYVAVPFAFNSVFSVDGESFLKTLKGFFEDEIKMDIHGDNLKLFAKKTKAEVPISSKILLQKEIKELFYAENWKKLPEDVVQGIDLCGFSTSNDLTRGLLFCVAVLQDKVISTDDIRMSKYNLKKSVVQKNKNWLIRSEYSHLFKKFELSSYVEQDGWINFANTKGMRFSVRRIAGSYPQNVDFFKKADKFTKFAFPEEFKKYLEFVIPLMSDILDYDKILRIKAQDKKFYSIVEREFVYKEKQFDLEKNVSFNFLINPVFLKQILDIGNEFYIDDKEHRLYFYSEDFSHILSLCLEG